jgi:alpha-L-rhamnosidase
MQMCAHETFMDCPYYEELQYAGDARLEMLTGYVMALDARLARKGIRLFDASRLPGGLTASRYPSRQLQIIAPFSLWWVAMVVDYAFWRDDPTTVQALMPGVRATLEAFERYRTPDGLIRAPEGWNFIDWAPEWSADAGAPPGATASVSGVLNWQLVYVQILAANLEEQLGEPELAARLRRRARQTAQGLKVFWDEGRGLYADDLGHTSFSEHTQSLAILSGLLPDTHRAHVAAGLIGDSGLVRATIFYMHYLFEAYRKLGRGDALLERMQLWFDLPEHGLRTPVEMPEPTRSDCHAWGSHPLFHERATILGVRPAGLGFRSVEIAPLLGTLTWAHGSLPHPRGTIEIDLRRDGDTLHAQITLPDGVEGTLHWQGQAVEVGAGRSAVVVTLCSG